MDERSAKYCEVASLNRALWDARELSAEDDEGPLDLALVKAWMASPAE